MALTTSQKAGWGLADMGINVFVVVKQLLVFAWLTSFLGVPPSVAGWVTFAVLGFDVLTDPLVGYLSDRTRSRWGRRAPWMVPGAVLLTVGILAMFAVPEGMAWQANLAWVGLSFALATVGFTFVAIPYSAMAGEITRDAQERSQMMAWRMSFAALGLLIAGAVIPAVAGESRAGHLTGVAVVVPLVIVTIWSSVWLTRSAPRIETPATGRPLEVLRLVTGNRGFLVLVGLYGVQTLAVAVVAAGLQLAARYLVVDAGGPLSGAVRALGMFSTLFACFVLGAVASQFGWARISAGLGKAGALSITVLLYIAVLLTIWTLLPSEDVTLMAALFFVAGVANGGYQQIPWAMYPDLMDLTRDATGEAVEGAFSAVWLFGQKVANAVAPLLLGLILSRAGWRESRSGTVAQAPEALDALRAALTLVPAGFFALSLLILLTLYRRAARPGTVNA